MVSIACRENDVWVYIDVNPLGKFLFLFSIPLLLIAGMYPAAAQSDQNLQLEAEQLMTLANQARAQSGAPALKWDPALAEAAMRHTRRMVSENSAIQHQYPGELELSERACPVPISTSLRRTSRSERRRRIFMTRGCNRRRIA